jgi:hypothetical protein
MGWSVTVARVRGIEIKVHASFVLILVWAAYYWGSVVDAGSRGIAFGVVAALGLGVRATLAEDREREPARRRAPSAVALPSGFCVAPGVGATHHPSRSRSPPRCSARVAQTSRTPKASSRRSRHRATPH